jgi:hypothetical protein
VKTRLLPLTLTLALAALFAARFTALGALDLGSQSISTPYDPYMRPVKDVLGSLAGQNASMEQVCKLMREGRSFRYSFTDPYVPALPAMTADRKAGDCKAKSLWLCSQLGDEKVRYVIGKVRRNAKLSHAWLLWQNEGRWWILDCTNASRPIAAETLPEHQYIPLYSYDKSGCYRHSPTTSIAVTGTKKSGLIAASSKQRR